MEILHVSVKVAKGFQLIFFIAKYFYKIWR